MLNTFMYNKKAYLLLITLFLIVCNTQAQLYGDFPYGEAFNSTIQPSDITLPAPGNTNYKNSATFTVNGLRLTEAKTNQFGAVFINNRQFSAKNGMHIEFEYSMYGGTSGGADGFTFFLFDASVQNPTIGAVGAGLGYSYNRALNRYSNLRNKGLSGGYLGISLDSYGNFKRKRYQGESLVNGIDWSLFSSINVKNHVTLRGAKGNVINSSISNENTSGLSDGYTGYPVLITQATSGTSSTNRRGIILNYDGSYSAISDYSGNFDLRNGSYTTNPSNSNYRKAIISMYPHENGGFLITVKIQHGLEITTIIDNYHYRTSLKYTENAIIRYGDYNGSTSSSPNSISTVYDLNTPVPEFLRFGFAASTGDYTDNHYIRMIQITLPGSAQAYDDSGQTYSGISTTIEALKNDLGYTGTVAQNQIGNSSYLDKTTFKFVDNDNVPSATPYEYTEEGVGAWKYNPSTGLVTFTPLPTFIGTATINYSIKAGIDNELPYSDEGYRSLPATISIVVEKPINTHVISNKFIQPILK